MPFKIQEQNTIHINFIKSLYKKKPSTGGIDWMSIGSMDPVNIKKP